MYDRILLTLIFLVDLTALLIQVRKARRTAQKARTTRRFNRVLKSVGL